MAVRQAAFAGSWYPGSAAACKAEIDQYLARRLGRDLADQTWWGGIVPHAGWYFSGHLAASVIRLLQEQQPPDVVVIFGMHLHPRSSNFMMPSGAWQTPVGDLPVAEELAGELQKQFSFQLETPDRFSPDNTIEVQLPFIKYILDPGAVLGLGVPPVPQAVDIGRAVARWALDSGRRVKVLGSTDLTHYGYNYDYAPQGHGPGAVEWVREKNDRRVIDAMVAMAPEQVLQEGLENRNACCAGAVAAALAAGQEMGATQGRLVAYASSYDKSPGESFVGYTGVVF